MKEFIIFGLGFLLTIMIIPWVRRFSHRTGYLDRSDGDLLKIHGLPIPHSGGIAIFGVFNLFLLLLFLTGKVNRLYASGLFLGGGLAFSLGVWDDLKRLSPPIRFGGEILSGLVLIFFEVMIAAPFFISLPLTIFFVVGAINAINLQDGLDGLAGGMALLSYLGFLWLSAQMGQGQKLLICLILSGVLIGFLFYNFNPASIFMGDSGSYFLGFVLAFLAVSFTSIQQWRTFIGPILIIGVPVLDTAFAILRRLKRGVSPFIGDRSHFYDFLVGKGLTVRQTVLICYIIQAVLVASGILLYTLGVRS